MKAYYAYTRLTPTDIYPIQYGEEQCECGHSFGPCVRSNYLLHYVFKGRGIFRINNEQYEVHEGEMFLISPDQLTYYRADENDPWLYRWIEFNGSLIPKLLELISSKKDRPIYSDDESRKTGQALTDIVKKGDMPFAELMQLFWQFIFTLTGDQETPATTPAHEYIRKAESFIKINIHKRITIQELSEYVGIDRSYLTRLFRTYKDTSPQEYMLSLKMNTAAQYLKNPGISIKEVALSVGYQDPHVFNKAFKKHFNISPSGWRNKQIYNRFIIEKIPEGSAQTKTDF